ncbi:hypothetical protein HPB48_023202 [Haemaphysalis longicornis]|uniref:Uncharacterized protein n=1 Tax=Haemaphysalis longicornis TaxID=44386 RepID=A0A9J6H6Z8_HAELO|nr:hypothetical protein HPB48_023202 [Haemaphysalis longicornis]
MCSSPATYAVTVSLRKKTCALTSEAGMAMDPTGSTNAPSALTLPVPAGRAVLPALALPLPRPASSCVVDRLASFSHSWRDAVDSKEDGANGENKLTRAFSVTRLHAKAAAEIRSQR